MFDMTKIGKKLAELRKERNMTQVELADKLGISYQAVSNWERGDSMPDIAKLSDLSEIFEVSIDYLLDNEKKANLVKEFLSEETPAIDNIDEEDLKDVLPLVKPDTIKKAVENSERIKSISLLTTIAPFLDENSLEEITEEIMEVDSKALVSIAPFLSQKSLKDLVKKVESNDLDFIVPIAPFLNEETLDELIENHKADFNTISSLAPFLSQKSLSKLVDSIEDSNSKELARLAPFLESEQLYKSALKCIDDLRFNDLAPLAPFLDSKHLGEIALILSDNENTDAIHSILPFLNSSDVSKLIAKELEKGNTENLQRMIMFADEDMLKEILKKNFNK